MKAFNFLEILLAHRRISPVLIRFSSFSINYHNIIMCTIRRNKRAASNQSTKSIRSIRVFRL